MEKYDIEPTTDNIISSIRENVTGRNADVYYFLKLLNSQQNTWSIAIDGKWGSGKSFFIKQCKWIADLPAEKAKISGSEKITLDSFLKGSSYEDIKKVPIKTVYYDAWTNDNSNDPLLSILQSIVSTPNWKSTTKKTLEKVINITSSLVTSFTKVNANALVKLLEDGKIVNQESERQKLQKQLSLLTPSNGRLVIFIDELDRCKPTFAVRLLERIKHFFQAPNITFVFAVDLVQLQNTIKHYYGEEFDGFQYLDRFFDLIIPLPEANIERYFDHTKGILQIDDLFGDVDQKNNYYHIFCKELIQHFSFSIRQINHFYLCANSSTYNYLSSNLKGDGFSPRAREGRFVIYTFILPIMVALNITNIESYRQFINGRASDDILEVLENNHEFNKFCEIDTSTENGKQQSKKIVKNIYNNIFGPRENSKGIVKINDNCYIETPYKYKQKLIKACSLLSPDISYNSNTLPKQLK